MTDLLPRVSIGMPVYNGAATLEAAIDALLVQSFRDFELIISDNASSDATEALCRQYAARDARIRYVRQSVNIGTARNFAFVLEHARAAWFMWAACDDLRSPDFLEVNLSFLDSHPDFVASTSPNRFAGMDLAEPVTFALRERTPAERFLIFFEHCWSSHGLFYSLMRTDVVRRCPALGEHLIAADWAFVLHLAAHGPINRTRSGFTRFGLRGISSGSGAFSAFRSHPVEYILPFRRLSGLVFAMARPFRTSEKVRLAVALTRVTVWADYAQARAWLSRRLRMFLALLLRR